MWFSFVDDLGHTLSVITQDTRYVSRCYWPHRVSQSSKHMSAHFLIKYSWIRSWEHSWQFVRLYIVPFWISPGSMPHLSRSIHSKRTSIASWSWNSLWIMTGPKMLCYNLTDGVSLSSGLWTNILTYQGIGDQVICVFDKLNTSRSPTMNKSDTLWKIVDCKPCDFSLNMAQSVVLINNKD